MKKRNDQLLDSGMASGHFVLASGNHAVEKFEFDNVARKWRLLRRSAHGLFDLAVEAPEFDEFDTFLTVGNGANCLARGLRKRSVKMKRGR